MPSPAGAWRWPPPRASDLSQPGADGGFDPPIPGRLPARLRGLGHRTSGGTGDGPLWRSRLQGSPRAVETQVLETPEELLAGNGLEQVVIHAAPDSFDHLSDVEFAHEHHQAEPSAP